MIPGIPLTNNSSSTVQTLTLTLGGAATTTYPTASVYSYIIPPQAKTVTSAQGYIAADPSEYRRAPEFTLLTAATKTTIAAAAPSGSVKMVTGVSIHNPDTVSMTMTVAIDDNGTTRVQAKWTLLTLETLYYGNGEWYCVDANGNRKEAATSVNSSVVLGTTTNDNAAAGRLGEYTSSTVASGSALSLTSDVALDVTTLSLTAGDWDVSGVVAYLQPGATSINSPTSSISTTSATVGALGAVTAIHNQGVTAADVILPTPIVRMSLASTTTVYLVAKTNFTVSTLKAYGFIRARRVR